MEPLSLPLNDALTVGAPLSTDGLAVPLIQLPLTMTCGDAASSTRLSLSPFLRVTELCTKLAPLICTVGPVDSVLVSTMAQAANRTVIVANTVKAINNFLYMCLPFDHAR